MPHGPLQNVPGSGISKRTRLPIPRATGDESGMVTATELNNILKQLGDWADRLQFGRVGFQAATYDPTTIGGVVTDQIIQFAEIIQDTNDYQDRQQVTPRTKFRIPPGLTRQYAVSWATDFAVVTSHTVTKSYTGSLQTFTVPATVTSLTVTCRGAQGGSGASQSGGKGAEVTATFSVNPGDIYDVYVGGQGTSVGGAGYPNGGAGDTAGSNHGYGGGGSSSIRPTGLTFADSLIVAGAGGGGADSFGAAHTCDGGYGAWSAAGNGAGRSANPVITGGGNAGGATSAAVGVAGYNTSFGGPVQGGNPGQNAASGGTGGNAANSTNGLAIPGGGGGGGWNGGGGAGDAQGNGTQTGSGGGGVSHVDASGTAITHADNSRSGNGEIVFTYITYGPPSSGDVAIKVWVNYAVWPDAVAYEITNQIGGSTGVPPYNGCLLLPLSAGDIVYLTVTNTVAAMDYTYMILSVWSIGE